MSELFVTLFFVIGLPCILASLLVLIALIFLFFGRKNTNSRKEEAIAVVELMKQTEKLGKRIKTLETIIMEERGKNSNTK